MQGNSRTVQNFCYSRIIGHDVSTESAQNCSFFVAWNPHILQKKLNENKNLGYVISNKGYKVSSGSNLKFLTYKLSNQFKPFVHIFSLWVDLTRKIIVHTEDIFSTMPKVEMVHCTANVSPLKSIGKPCVAQGTP